MESKHFGHYQVHGHRFFVCDIGIV